MKFPKRQKRGSISAHTAATTPIGLSPALSAVRSIVEKTKPIEDPTQPKLRRKHKSANLYLDSVFDEELTEIDPATGHWVAIPFGRTRTLSAPMIILTPPSPEKADPLDEAGGVLARAASAMGTVQVPRSLSFPDLGWLASAAGRAIANALPYWRASEKLTGTTRTRSSKTLSIVAASSGNISPATCPSCDRG
ncbi:hypothetical protein P171DRAFT_446908 [Karstenula rhodostoma CBS 690.94]|uniref:Uncharacterized protein n=1 Tax=Karstenula rhodostoma CBS 690.94 TaxID=1392251 RepID=A0A9P4PDD1_9PLEO|nr:hypothetical protein P171DRAFT_446908 [Karstenula rhodostoma CBS 690.94]